MSDADLHSLDASIVALSAKVQGLQQSCRHMEAGKTGHLARVPWFGGHEWPADRFLTAAETPLLGAYDITLKETQT